MRSKSLISLPAIILSFSLVHFELEASASEAVDSSLAAASTDEIGNPERKILAIDSARGFSKGTQTWQTYASVAAGDHGKGEMYALHVGYSSFLWDYLSVNIDLLGAYVRSGIDDNGIAVGLDINRTSASKAAVAVLTVP